MARLGMRLGIGSAGGGVLVLLVAGVMALFGGGYKSGAGDFSSPYDTFDLWEESLEDNDPALYAFCFKAGLYRPADEDAEGAGSPDAFRDAFAEKMEAYGERLAALNDLEEKRGAIQRQLGKDAAKIWADARRAMKKKLDEVDERGWTRARAAEEKRNIRSAADTEAKEDVADLKARRAKALQDLTDKIARERKRLATAKLPKPVRNLVREFARWRKLMKEQDFSGPSWKVTETAAAARIEGKTFTRTVLLGYYKKEDGWKVVKIK